MTVYELLEKVGGEIVRGKARFRQGAEYIVIGQLNGDDMIFTEAGRLMAAGDTVEPEPEQKGRRTRPSKSSVVESEQFSPESAA